MFCWPCISLQSLQITNLTHSSFPCMFISILYMFRTAMCPSSGELIVSIRHLVYVTLCRWPSGMQVWMEMEFHPNMHTRRVTYTRRRIDTINSPDDGHIAVGNTYRIEMNTHEEELCVKLVIYEDFSTELVSILDFLWSVAHLAFANYVLRSTNDCRIRCFYLF